jgi:hypothetical protein
MLHEYGRQLVNARRLARYKRSLRLAGMDPETRNAREAKRRLLVERVSREIVDNLLVTGAENPIVDEIVSDLENRYACRFIFEYPFMEQDLQIFRETGDGPKKLTADETSEVLSNLWDITLKKVDETMV